MLSARQLRQWQRQEAARLPDMVPDWEAEKAVLRLFFADSRETQRAARQAVKQLSERGPIQRRRALRLARQATPQAKRALDRKRLWTKLIPYLLEREFVWHFLRHEALAEGWGRADLGRRVDGIGGTLSQEYPYFHLIPEQISIGLCNIKRQIVLDVAEEFTLSPTAIRPLVSKLLS